MNELLRLTIGAIALTVGATILFVKYPAKRQILKWSWLILAGAGLNLAAIIGNGGMMPYLHIMSNAWWVWLGDWIGWVASPGDILIFIGGFGMIAIFLISRRRSIWQNTLGIASSLGRKRHAPSLVSYVHSTTRQMP